MDYKKE